MRLTNEIRREIMSTVRQKLNDNADLKDLEATHAVTQDNLLAAIVEQEVRGHYGQRGWEAWRKAVEALPKLFIREVCVRIAVPEGSGDWSVINASGAALPCMANHQYSGPIFLAGKEASKYLDAERAAVEALRAKKSELDKEWRRLSGVIDSCTTDKRLREVWPDGASIYNPILARHTPEGAGKALAPVLDNVNKLLGLPPEQVEEEVTE